MISGKKEFSIKTGVWLAFLSALFFLGAQGASAQEGREGIREIFPLKAESLSGAIGAERPGFSFGPLPLDRGRFQLEGGYQFTSDGDGGKVKEHTAPLLLLRFGLLKNLELQVSWPGYTWKRADGEWNRNPADTVLAVKTQLTAQKGGMPSLGLLAALSVPTGSGDATSNDLDPALGILWSYEAAGLGFFGNVLLANVSGQGPDFLQMAVSAGVGAPWTRRLGSYLEYFAFFKEDRRPAHNLNGGFTYLLTPDFQIDLHGGVGMNREANDYFLGAGFAKRW